MISPQNNPRSSRDSSSTEAENRKRNKPRDKVSKVNPLATDRKIYRFAVYGWRDSGKTCLMAALGMPRKPNFDGYTATRVALQAPQGKVARDSPLAPFVRGHNWLNKAISSIAKGGVPPASPNTEPVSFLFEFAAPGEGPWLVEMVDFSGELVNPNSKIADLADNLREKLKSFDALFVLGEHPRESSNKKLSTQLSKVLEAFSLLQSQKKTEQRFATPVALLLNKWDRSGSCEQPTPEDVRRFLNSPNHEQHLNLRNALANAADKENFECFPVSAFGESDLRSLEDGTAKVDHPKNKEILGSVALENPFVWACRRRDEVDLSAFEEKVEGRSFWKLWQLFSIRRTSREGRLLRRRFRKKSTPFRRTRSAQNQAFAVARNLIATTTLLVVTLLSSIEYQIDEQAFRKNQSTLESPDSSINEFHAAVDWYKSYYSSPKWRHLPYSTLQLPKLEARQLAASWEKERETTEMQVVLAENDTIQKGILAEKFLTVFPNSESRGDLESYVHAGEILTKKHQLANKAHVDDVVAYGSSIQQRLEKEETSPQLLVSIGEFEKKINEKVPHLPLDEKLKSTLSSWRKKSASFRGLHKDNLLAERALKELNTNNFESAIQTVMGITSNSNRYSKIKERVANTICDDLKSKASKAVDVYEKIEIAKDIKNYLVDSNASLIFGRPSVKELSRLNKELNDSSSQQLWEIARSKYADSERVRALRDYLDRAPNQKMKGYADDYLDWYDKINGPLDLRFEVKVKFGDIYDWWHYDYELTVNGDRMVYEGYADRDDNERLYPNFVLKDTKLSENIVIRAISTYQNGSDRDNGSGKFTGTPRELISGKTIDMRLYDNETYIVLDTDSLPTDPGPLPKWKL